MPDVVVIEWTKAEWDAYRAGPDGTCEGCNEPNQFCECDDDA